MAHNAPDTDQDAIDTTGASMSADVTLAMPAWVDTRNPEMVERVLRRELGGSGIAVDAVAGTDDEIEGAVFDSVNAEVRRKGDFTTESFLGVSVGEDLWEQVLVEAPPEMATARSVPLTELREGMVVALEILHDRSEDWRSYAYRVSRAKSRGNGADYTEVTLDPCYGGSKTVEAREKVGIDLYYGEVGRRDEKVGESFSIFPLADEYVLEEVDRPNLLAGMGAELPVPDE